MNLVGFILIRFWYCALDGGQCLTAPSLSLYLLAITSLTILVRITSLKIYISHLKSLSYFTQCRSTRWPGHWPYNLSALVWGKAKQSRNRHAVALRVPGGLDSQISMTFGTWRWWGRQPHSPAAFTLQKMFLVLIFTRGWFDPRAMVRSEGNMSLKNVVTQPGIDPGTVRLVAQRLNHYATAGPLVWST